MQIAGSNTLGGKRAQAAIRFEQQIYHLRLIGMPTLEQKSATEMPRQGFASHLYKRRGDGLFDELQQVLDHGGVDRIMLDNFSVPDTKKAVDIINHRYETESSGGITFDTIRDYAEQGVDFISVGALTHSVKGLDMSFKACD